MLLRKTKPSWNPTENLEEAGLSCEMVSSLICVFLQMITNCPSKEMFSVSSANGADDVKSCLCANACVFNGDEKPKTPTDLSSYKDTLLCHPAEISKH